MIREFFQSQLVNDVELASIVGGHVYAAESVEDAPLPRIVHRWGLSTPSFQRVKPKTSTLTLWFYDGPDRDFGRVDAMVGRVEKLFPEIVGTKLAAGVSVTQVDWMSTSEDEYDDIFEAVYKTSEYRVICSGM